MPENEEKGTAPARGDRLRDVLPLDRGLPAALLDLIIRPGRALAERRAHGAGARVTPMQVYLASAAIGLGAAALVGEENTGAVYVFGGGVFGKVDRWGAWLAYLLVVPVVAAWMRVAWSGVVVAWRDHVAFALEFGAFVLLCVAAEASLLWLLPGDSPLRGPASALFLAPVLAWFFLAQRDAFGASLVQVLMRGLLVLLGYLLVFALAVVALARWIEFTL